MWICAADVPDVVRVAVVGVAEVAKVSGVGVAEVAKVVRVAKVSLAAGLAAHLTVSSDGAIPTQNLHTAKY